MSRAATTPHITNMNTIQLNAEIYRTMSVIAEDEGLLKQALKYLKKLAAKKPDKTLMTEEEFLAKLDRAEKDIKEGKGTTFTNLDSMHAWLNSL